MDELFWYFYEKFLFCKAFWPEYMYENKGFSSRVTEFMEVLQI